MESDMNVSGCSLNVCVLMVSVEQNQRNELARHDQTLRLCGSGWCLQAAVVLAGSGWCLQVAATLAALPPLL